MNITVDELDYDAEKQVDVGQPEPATPQDHADPEQATSASSWRTSPRP